MRSQQIRKQLVELLARRPLIPVVIEGTTGARVVVDAPEQLTIETHGVRFRRSERAPLVSFPYDDVRQIMGLDQIPAKPGRMGYAEFYARVRPLYWADPFRPFVIELKTGDRVVVETSKRLTLAGRFGTYWFGTRPGRVRFSVGDVVAVTAADVPAAG